jgi:ABC-2 type transport system permease protein
MAAVTAPAAVPTVERRSAMATAVADAVAVTWRNLKGMMRTPEVIVFSTIQPVIFVLTFRYVFGGAIRTPGFDYVDFLMPGVFVQTVAFGSISTGIGLSEDLHKGMIERFRSLPMARSAVIAGRTMADLVRNVVVVLLMVGVGFAVGFRVHTGVIPFVASILLLLLFSFALSWVFVLIGLRAPNAEAAQAGSFPILAVLVFASSAFVPIATMPGWLQAYNHVQPVSVTVEAARALSMGGPTRDHLLGAIAWSIAIVAVFAPMGVRRYRRAA